MKKQGKEVCRFYTHRLQNIQHLGSEYTIDLSIIQVGIYFNNVTKLFWAQLVFKGTYCRWLKVTC